VNEALKQERQKHSQAREIQSIAYLSLSEIKSERTDGVVRRELASAEYVRQPGRPEISAHPSSGIDACGRHCNTAYTKGALRRRGRAALDRGVAFRQLTGRDTEAHDALQRYLALPVTGPQTIAAWKASATNRSGSLRTRIIIRIGAIARRAQSIASWALTLT
jgi:hypothetical protein